MKMVSRHEKRSFNSDNRESRIAIKGTSYMFQPKFIAEEYFLICLKSGSAFVGEVHER